MFVSFVLIVAFASGILYNWFNLSSRVRRGFSRKSEQGAWKRLQWLSIHQLVVCYLLVRIGFVGGAEVAELGWRNVVLPGFLAIGLSVTLCLMTFGLLTLTSSLPKESRVTLAAHFGSVSIGTFAAASAFLSGFGITFSPAAGAWVAVMELPAVFVGILLLGQKLGTIVKVFCADKKLLLLPFACLVGVVSGPTVVHLAVVAFAFQTAFEPVLIFFLFDMGHLAGSHLRALLKDQLSLAFFGIFLPLIGGTIGAAVSSLVGMGVGDVVVFAVLGASASYVAVPVAMKQGMAVLCRHDPARAARALTTGMTVALGVTLPFNLVVGLHLYLLEARLFQSNRLAIEGLLYTMVLTAVLAFGHKLKSIVWRFRSYQQAIVSDPRHVGLGLDVGHQSRSIDVAGMVGFDVESPCLVPTCDIGESLQLGIQVTKSTNGSRC